MRALALVLALAACATPEPKPSYQISPYSSGIEVIGTGQEIGFGRDASGAITALSKVKGPRFRRVDAPDCTRLIWDDGFEAHFTPAFSGWVWNGQSAGRLC